MGSLQMEGGGQGTGQAHLGDSCTGQAWVTLPKRCTGQVQVQTEPAPSSHTGWKLSSF